MSNVQMRRPAQRLPVTTSEGKNQDRHQRRAELPETSRHAVTRNKVWNSLRAQWCDRSQLFLKMKHGEWQAGFSALASPQPQTVARL